LEQIHRDDFNTKPITMARQRPDVKNEKMKNWDRRYLEHGSYHHKSLSTAGRHRVNLSSFHMLTNKIRILDFDFRQNVFFVLT
jgi:hypothetical protein